MARDGGAAFADGFCGESACAGSNARLRRPRKLRACITILLSWGDHQTSSPRRSTACHILSRERSRDGPVRGIRPPAGPAGRQRRRCSSIAYRETSNQPPTAAISSRAEISASTRAIRMHARKAPEPVSPTAQRPRQARGGLPLCGGLSAPLPGACGCMQGSRFGKRPTSAAGRLPGQAFLRKGFEAKRRVLVDADAVSEAAPAARDAH